MKLIIFRVLFLTFMLGAACPSYSTIQYAPAGTYVLPPTSSMEWMLQALHLQAPKVIEIPAPALTERMLGFLKEHPKTFATIALIAGMLAYKHWKMSCVARPALSRTSVLAPIAPLPQPKTPTASNSVSLHTTHGPKGTTTVTIKQGAAESVIKSNISDLIHCALSQNKEFCVIYTKTTIEIYQITSDKNGDNFTLALHLVWQKPTQDIACDLFSDRDQTIGENAYNLKNDGSITFTCRVLQEAWWCYRHKSITYNEPPGKP